MSGGSRTGSRPWVRAMSASTTSVSSPRRPNVRRWRAAALPVVERRLGQREDLLPVAELLQLRAQVVHEAGDQQLGRDELGLVALEVDEIALEARARRPPTARAQQLVTAVRERAARLEVGAGAADEGPEQARDEHDVLDVRAGVAHPQLDGGQVRAGPDVEVDHPGVGDRARRDELVDHRVVVGARLDVAGRPRGRPARPHHAAVAGVSGVLGPPVGRAGGDREQRREVRRDAAHDLHGDVPVRHVDVHLRAADVLLAHQQLVLVLHAFVARARGDVVAVEVDQRHGARRDHAQPERLGHRLQRAAQAAQVAAELVERGADGGVGLDERALQLGGELRAVELGQQRVDLGADRRVCRSTT